MTSVDSLEDAVDRVIQDVGPDLNVATPLGLGKPVHFLNALYRRAGDNSDIDLTFITALSLKVPEPSSELEERLTGPLYERLFGDYPRLEYAHDLDENNLPDNVEVKEFYVQPGTRLYNSHSQQHYVNTNYTYAVRDIVGQGVNVIAQMVTPSRSVSGRENPVHSLSCNADLTLDLIDRLEDHHPDRDYRFIGQVNKNLPFMHGDCLLETDRFDELLEYEEFNHTLFGPPSEPLSETDYAIGLHASRLVRDGGTLQVGIGSLGDAITRMLILRHRTNEDYRSLAEAFDYAGSAETTVDKTGGEDPFDRGLYASTEMFVRGFEELYRAGVLTRRVFDQLEIQRYVNDRGGDTRVELDLVDRLVDEEVISESLSPDDLNLLRRYGIFRDGVRLEDDSIKLPDGSSPENDLSAEETRHALERSGLGSRLKHGVVAHAGFFLGPPSMYDFLRDLSASDRRSIRMERISFVNDLYGQQNLKMAQRQQARFINTAMKVTLTGAVVSDALENMRAVSGVGGQYNFVSMAQDLPGARSIIMVRSTRESNGEVESNIVWNYGHTTIPRHLRDIVVTEYGIADLRGCTDRQVVESMLSVSDARFQDELVEAAKESDKLPEDWTLPSSYRENTPENLSDWYESADERVGLPEFPFGSELTDVELNLARGLRSIREKWETKSFRLADLSVLSYLYSTPPSASPYLDRMNLLDPVDWGEWLQQRAVLLGLESEGVL